MILVNESKKIFVLQTNNTEYVFGIDPEGLIRHLYWGNKIGNDADFEMPVLNEVSTNDPVYEITPEEFPVFGGLRYSENCLKVCFNDKTRDIVYKYDGYKL